MTTFFKRISEFGMLPRKFQSQQFVKCPSLFECKLSTFKSQISILLSILLEKCKNPETDMIGLFFIGLGKYLYICSNKQCSCTL